MSRNSADAILNSLKGRIWLAVGAMAVINCAIGLLAYLAVSLLSINGSVSVFIAFFLSVLAILGLGWWLCNEVLRPVDKVTTLAQSLERNPATSLPKTTGASETDDLLRSLHRNSQQMHNLIALMDDVAAGKTDIVALPLQNSDRLSASFQKLVAKVTDSIDAKKDLISIQTAVTRLTADIAPIIGGDLGVTIHSNFAETREICDTLKYLVVRLNELARTVHMNTGEAKGLALEVQKALRISIQNDENRHAKLARASAMLTEMPNGTLKVSADIANAVTAAAYHARGGEIAARTIAESSQFGGSLRRNINEIGKKAAKLRQISDSVPQLAKIADDMARRANLIALNTSIRREEPVGGGAIVVDEITSLSARAESVSKEIASLHEKLVRETSEFENAMKEVAASLPSVHLDAAAQDVAESLAKSLSELTSIPAKLATLADEHAGKCEQSLGLLEAAEPPADRPDLKLPDAETHMANLLRQIESLQESTRGLRPLAVAPIGAGSKDGQLGSSQNADTTDADIHDEMHLSLQEN